MGGEWNATTLGHLVDIFDGPHATPKKTPSGPLFLGISNLSQGRLDLGSTEHLSEEAFKKWTRRVTPSPGDVVFSYETRLGEVALIPDGLRCCLGRRMGLLRPKKGRIDSRFLLYAYLGPEFQETLRQRTVHGSTVDRIPLIEMPGFPIRVPGVDEQRAIAHVLGTLDDKIELNRRMNETLESMARALFKSWFVDFDPVCAKAQGQTPGAMDPATAGLFPSELQDSELGEIPKGWRFAPLKEWVDALSGGTPSKKNAGYWGGDIPWISPKVMTTIHADRAEHYVTEAAIGNGTRLAPAGATLVMVRGMGLHQEVRVSQALREVTFNQDVKALVATHIEPTLLLYALLDARQVLLGRVESSGHGTGRLPSDVLLSYPLVMPALGTQTALARTFTDINRRIALLRAESQTLARTRDALLPRLLSGELSLAAAEHAVEATA
jgi:type I restriction enzyme S subunit